MGLFSSIGGILGGVVGSIIPGVGTAIGATVGAGLGGAAGSAIDANQANKKAQGYYNQQMDFAKQQAQFQQDYVKQMMQWRVEDAKKAGVHPMAALGVSNPSYSPVSAPSAPQVYDAGQFDTGSTFGQSLNRASMQAKTMEQQEQAAKLGFQTVGLQNKGLELDNQFKALQIAQLASELQRNAASSAPAPAVNGDKTLIGGQNDAIVGNSFSSGTTPLLSLSRVGNTLMGHINPDISDSLTEDMIRNQLANLNAEFQAGRITPEVYAHLTKQERDLIKKGDLVLEYSFPSTWRLRYTSRMKPKYANDNREAGGKLNFYHMKY